MTSELWTLDQAVQRFQQLHRRQGWKLGLLRLLWVAAASFLVLVYLDVIFQLDAQWRIGLTAGFLALLATAAAVPVFRYMRAAAQRRMIVRLVEASHPELHNDLINAIDFDERLRAAAPHRFSADLMQQEISVASEKASRLAPSRAMPAPALRTETWLLVAAVALTAAFATFFPRMFTTVIARYIDPFGDHVPYNATLVHMDPAGLTVEYGADVIITAALEGPKAESVTLKLEDADGNAVGEMAMIAKGDGTYFQTVENVQHDLVYHAAIPRGRSNRFQLALDKAPRIGSAMVTFKYPPYTKLPDKTRLITNPADLEAYKGTTVELALVSNRPLSGGAWNVPGDEVAFQPSTKDEHTAIAALSLQAAGPFTASITDIEGIPSKETFNGTLAVQPDNKPAIEITSPGRQAIASVDAEVPIAIEASDDLGILSVQLIRTLNGLPDLRKDLFAEAESQIYVNTVETLKLADLGVRPGDIIEFYATATDTLPEAPQTVATPVYQLQIISEEDYRSFMQEEMTASDLTEKYDKIKEQIDAIAEEQVALEEQISQLTQQLAATGELDEASKQALAQAQAAQEALAQKAGDLAKEIAEEAEKTPIYDVEKSYQESMKEMAKQLASAKENMEQSAQNMADSQSAQSSEAAKQNMQASNNQQKEALKKLGHAQEMQQQIQQANKEIEELYDLMENVERFKYLYEQQDSLERQARFFQHQQAPTAEHAVRLAELAQQQEQIRKALSELKQEFRDNAGKVEESMPKVAEDARRIADEIESRNIEPTMDNATGGLAQGNAQTGHAQAETARNQMKEMIKICNSASGSQAECEMRLNITMNNSMGNTMAQMKAGMGKRFGQGMMGGMGQGSGGTDGGSTPFDVFGNQAFGDPKKSKEARAGRKQNRDAPIDPGQDPFSGNIEEAAYEKAMDLPYDMPESERYVEEYRGLISAYFKGIAEEDQ